MKQTINLYSILDKEKQPRLLIFEFPIYDETNIYKVSEANGKHTIHYKIVGDRRTIMEQFKINLDKTEPIASLEYNPTAYVKNTRLLSALKGTILVD